LRRYSNSKPYA